MAKFIVDWCETAQTKTGKSYKKATLIDEERQQLNVSIWDDYGSFAAVMPGAEVYGVIRVSPDGKYKNLVDGNLGPKPRTIPAPISKAMDRKDESIKHAQENKGESIRISATFRDATLIALQETANFPDQEGRTYEDYFSARWQFWRQWLWKNWPVDSRDMEVPF